MHGATIDERTQVSIILESLTPAFSQFTTNYVMNKLQYNMTQLLESLTPAFSQFTTNYVMNKLQYNMTQLLNELQTFEAISKTRPKEGEANVVEHKPSSS